MKRIYWQDWITADPKICGGKPCIKGTRISVELILDKLAAGESHPQLLTAFPHLTEEGIQAAIGFASENLKSDVVYPLYPLKKASGE